MAGTKLFCSKQDDLPFSPSSVILLCSDHVWLHAQFCRDRQTSHSDIHTQVCSCTHTAASVQILLTITLLNISTPEQMKAHGLNLEPPLPARQSPHAIKRVCGVHCGQDSDCRSNSDRDTPDLPSSTVCLGGKWLRE